MSIDISSTTTKPTKETKCSFCLNKTSFPLSFPSCTHSICPSCLFQRLFRFHITDLKQTSTITVKCFCEDTNSSLSLSLDNILTMFSDKFNVDDQCISEDHASFQMCSKHNGQYTNYFCTQCRVSLCLECTKRQNNPHYTHRVVDSVSHMKKLKRSVESIPSMQINKETFMNTIDATLNVLKEVIHNNLYKKLKMIDGLMETMALLRKEYETEFRKELQLEMQKIKVLKLFYLNYFYEKEQVGQTEDLRLLSFVNDIDVNFVGIKKAENNVYECKLSEIKNAVDALRKMPPTKLVEYVFEKVPRGFVQDSVIELVYESQTSLCLVEMSNGELVTASKDAKICVWKEEETEDKTQFAYVKTQSNVTSAGAVICLLLLDDEDNIATSSKSDNSIKIWATHDGVRFISALKRHTKPVRSMARLNNGKFMSGSGDASVIIWSKDTNNNNNNGVNCSYEAVQIIQSVGGGVTLLLSMNNARFACVVDYGEIHIYAKPNVEPKVEVIGNEKQNNNNDNDDIVDVDYALLQKIEKYVPEGRNIGKEKVTPVVDMCEANGPRYLFACGQFGVVVYRMIVKGKNLWRYEKAQVICEEKCLINSIIELYDGRIAYSTQNRTIRLFRLIEEEGNAVYKADKPDDVLRYAHGLLRVIQLKDGRLAACSMDKKVVMWRSRSIN